MKEKKLGTDEINNYFSFFQYLVIVTSLIYMNQIRKRIERKAVENKLGKEKQNKTKTEKEKNRNQGSEKKEGKICKKERRETKMSILFQRKEIKKKKKPKINVLFQLHV